MSEPMTLAAEYALRLLEGEELLEARRLLASDPAFAAEVAWWEEQFSPLYDDIPEVTPSVGLWQRIAARLDEPATNLVAMKRQLTRWRAATAATAAAAAVLLGLQLRPQPPAPVPGPVQTQAAPVLVASLVGEEAPEALTVAYRPDSRLLVISPARVAAPADRARQLWLIAEGRPPVSLGLVASDGVQRRVVPPAIAALFGRGATIAVSDEPAGGSPTGQPTGAVLAAGGLDTV
jgi:anti-sigma-K factor RskA